MTAVQRHLPELERRIIERLRPSESRCVAWRMLGWLIFAVDGSRFECPRTTANEQALGCAAAEKTTPQLFQTTLQHMGTGLPWDIRIGPGTDSERRHLDQMLPGLPLRSLLTADAGFISFDLARRLCEQGHVFVMRVGGNKTLLTDWGWEYEVKGQTVYLWPDQKRNQRPVVLRLIVLRDDVHLPIYLLTNVLDPAELSDEAAQAIYELRWGIELYYRSHKQTWDHPKLLSHSPQAARLELFSHIVAVWLLQSLAGEALKNLGTPPRQLSPAKCRDAIRQVLREALTGRTPRRGRSLRDRLSRALIDNYKRKGPKQIRAWPRKKQEHPPNPPKMRPATQHERERAKGLWNNAFQKS